MSGLDPAVPVVMDPRRMPAPEGEIRHGRRKGPPDVRMLGGYFAFDSPDAALMVSLLPALLHVRGIERFSRLVTSCETSPSNSDRVAILSCAVWSKCCWSKHCAAHRAMERHRVCCGHWQTPGWQQRCGKCTATRRIRGRRTSWRRRPRSRGQRSSSGFRGRLGCRPWNTFLNGAWRSRRIFSLAATSHLPRSPNVSATARRAPSAPPSAAMSDKLRVGMHASESSCQSANATMNDRSLARAKSPPSQSPRSARSSPHRAHAPSTAFTSGRCSGCVGTRCRGRTRPSLPPVGRRRNRRTPRAPGQALHRRRGS